MRIKLIKNRSDIGAGTRGADMGIDAIEIAAINQGNDYFNRFPFEDVKTHNESVYDKVRNSVAKRIEYVYEQCSRVSATIKSILKDGYFPVILSGDHSSALGTISGIKAAFPDKEIGVVWIDAHADLHSPHTSPSGNIHGMPLAAAMGVDNMTCKLNDVGATTQKWWNAMKEIGIETQKLKPQNLVFFGVRDTEQAENHLIESLEIRNFSVAEVRYRGITTCIVEALERLQDADIIYISFDADSLDCDMISYGTGTPVPKGFDPYEVEALIEGIVKSEKVLCLEVVEVNPLLDLKGNKMAETVFEVLDAVTATILRVNAEEE